MIKMGTIALGLKFVKTLTINKITNSFLIRLSYILSRIFKTYLHWGHIESMSIEPTNLCNLKCPECPSGNNKMTRQRLFLGESEYKKIISENYKYLSYLQLFFQGEPFMHPKMTTFIKYAVDKNIFTSTATNGHFLTPEISNKIVSSGLHQIIISIDGTTQKVFEKYRVGGSLDKVINGINNLQHAKKLQNKKSPHIVMQFVVFSTNEHQITDIKKLAKKLNVTDLRLKSAQIEDFKNGSSLIPKQNKYSRYKLNTNKKYDLKRAKKFKCFRIWSGAVINAESELLPCCFDKDAKYSFAATSQANIHEQWKNKKAVSFRQSVWQNPDSKDICRNCTEGLKKTWFN